MRGNRRDRGDEAESGEDLRTVINRIRVRTRVRTRARARARARARSQAMVCMASGLGRGMTAHRGWVMHNWHMYSIRAREGLTLTLTLALIWGGLRPDLTFHFLY